VRVSEAWRVVESQVSKTGCRGAFKTLPARRPSLACTLKCNSADAVPAICRRTEYPDFWEGKLAWPFASV
jgi:hypothetical protein